MGVFGLVIVLIGLAAFATGSSGEGVLYLVLGSAFLARGVWSSSVQVGSADVVTRSMIRTRHYSFDDVTGVEVRVGTTGLNGYDREHLVFHFTDGGERAFTELNCRPSEVAPSVVRNAAACIEASLSKHRAGMTGRP